jgi:threonine/homoserine/homoserine lactone efflux protein
MPWAAYGSFLAVAIVLVLIPGPDFAVVTKNTLAAGRARGQWCALGVASSNAVQGSAAVAGLGALILRLEPLFEAIKWAGVVYLAYLGAQAMRSAVAGRYEESATPADHRGAAVIGWRQGFLSNITNPKVLVFYIAVLPQFLGSTASITVLLVFALSHALLSFSYLTLVVRGLTKARALLTRRRVRRSLDAATGTALLAFSTRLAVEHA